MIAEEVAEILLKSEAVLLRPEKPFRFSSGILSPVYCDNRLLLSRTEERKKIVDFYIKKTEEEKIDFDVVAGIATASIPWAALIAQKLDKPMIYVRKAAKDHGRENLIEGGLEKGRKVLMVEDLVSTGGTSISSVKAARAEGAIVENCLAIFTYGMQKAKEGFAGIGCGLASLSSFSALTGVAARKGLIREEDMEILSEWNRNPQEWGKKHSMRE